MSEYQHIGVVEKTPGWFRSVREFTTTESNTIITSLVNDIESSLPGRGIFHKYDRTGEIDGRIYNAQIQTPDNSIHGYVRLVPASKENGIPARVQTAFACTSEDVQGDLELCIHKMGFPIQTGNKRIKAVPLMSYQAPELYAQLRKSLSS